MITRLTVLAFASVLLFGRAEATPTGATYAHCGAVPHFATGPVVDGHSRQPTQKEFEERLRAREAWSRMAAACGPAERDGVSLSGYAR